MLPHQVGGPATDSASWVKIDWVQVSLPATPTQMTWSDDYAVAGADTGVAAIRRGETACPTWTCYRAPVTVTERREEAVAAFHAAIDAAA